MVPDPRRDGRLLLRALSVRHEQRRGRTRPRDGTCVAAGRLNGGHRVGGCSLCLRNRRRDGGRTGWRLPDLVELFSLLAILPDDRREPAGSPFSACPSMVTTSHITSGHQILLGHRVPRGLWYVPIGEYKGLPSRGSMCPIGIGVCAARRCERPRRGILVDKLSQFTLVHAFTGATHTGSSSTSPSSIPPGAVRVGARTRPSQGVSVTFFGRRTLRPDHVRHHRRGLGAQPLRLPRREGNALADSGRAAAARPQRRRQMQAARRNP